MLIIDPMHNLFLGSAKYFTQKILIHTGILDNSKLILVNERLQSVHIPFHIGRLPTKIGTGTTFTAHQWMNWTLYLSVFCLHGLIPQSHLECWRSFVLACRRLCRRTLTENDVTVADLLLVQFCKRVHRLFGYEFVTPNMHLHNHLASCIRDFGPLHAFWLYAFERYNGLLGNLPNNNRGIEIQLMQRFARDNSTLDLISQAGSMDLLEEFGEVVLGHAKKFSSVEPENMDESSLTFPPRYCLSFLDTHLTEELRKVYVDIYPQYSQFFSERSEEFPHTCRKYEYVVINGRKLPSSSPNCPSYVMAKPVSPFPSCSGEVLMDDCRPTEVQYFIKHAFRVTESTAGSNHEHTFAICRWPRYHPEHQYMGKPVQIFCKGIYEATGINTSTIIPLENITTQVISAKGTVNNESVLVIIPLCNT